MPDQETPKPLAPLVPLAEPSLSLGTGAAPPPVAVEPIGAGIGLCVSASAVGSQNDTVPAEVRVVNPTDPFKGLLAVENVPAQPLRPAPIMRSDAGVAEDPDYAARVRAIIDRLGLTIPEFAERIGMSESGLKKIIYKPFQTPQPHNIRNINAIAPPELRIRLDVGEPALPLPAAAMEASPQSQDRLERLQTLLTTWRELSDEERAAVLAILRITSKP